MTQCRTMLSQRPCGNVQCERPECSNKGKNAVPALRMVDVVTEKGIPFRVTFGRRKYRDGSYSTTEVVSFYDSRYDFTEHGQFVSDYNPETLLEMRTGTPLHLQGGEPNWVIDGWTMRLVTSWLVHHIATREF